MFKFPSIISNPEMLYTRVYKSYRCGCSLRGLVWGSQNDCCLAHSTVWNTKSSKRYGYGPASMLQPCSYLDLLCNLFSVHVSYHMILSGCYVWCHDWDSVINLKLSPWSQFSTTELSRRVFAFTVWQFQVVSAVLWTYDRSVSLGVLLKFENTEVGNQFEQNPSARNSNETTCSVRTRYPYWILIRYKLILIR